MTRSRDVAGTTDSIVSSSVKSLGTGLRVRLLSREETGQISIVILFATVAFLWSDRDFRNVGGDFPDNKRWYRSQI